MPRVSYAHLLRSWQGLLDEVGEHRPDLDLEPLSESLKELRELRTIQAGLVGARRRVTERQREVREQGQEQARRLKGLLTRHGRKEGHPKSPAIPEQSEAPSERTRAAKLRDWQRLLTALREHHTDLPHLERHREQLETLLHHAQELVQTQAALSSIRHGATKQLSELLADGQRLMTVLRYSVRQHYGPSAEKLSSFGIQPFRSRNLAESAD